MKALKNSLKIALPLLSLAAASSSVSACDLCNVYSALDAHGSLRGKSVAIQEYGTANPELIAGR